MVYKAFLADSCSKLLMPSGSQAADCVVCFSFIISSGLLWACASPGLGSNCKSPWVSCICISEEVFKKHSNCPAHPVLIWLIYCPVVYRLTVWRAWVSSLTALWKKALFKSPCNSYWSSVQQWELTTATVAFVALAETWNWEKGRKNPYVDFWMWSFS